MVNEEFQKPRCLIQHLRKAIILRKLFVDFLPGWILLWGHIQFPCQTSVFEQESIFGQRHKDVRIYYRRQFLGIKDLRLSNM